MFIKIHKAYRDIVAICDANLIGKKFEEDKFQIDIKENFFKGEKTSEEQVIKLIQDFSKEDATFNIVGEKACKTALKAGVIDKQSIGKIKNIPFALVLF